MHLKPAPLDQARQIAGPLTRRTSKRATLKCVSMGFRVRKKHIAAIAIAVSAMALAESRHRYRSRTKDAMRWIVQSIQPKAGPKDGGARKMGSRKVDMWRRHERPSPIANRHRSLIFLSHQSFCLSPNSIRDNRTRVTLCNQPVNTKSPGQTNGGQANKAVPRPSLPFSE